MFTLVETGAESSEILRVNIGRDRIPVFVDHVSLCKLLILLVDDSQIVVTDLKEDHCRRRPLSK